LDELGIQGKFRHNFPQTEILATPLLQTSSMEVTTRLDNTEDHACPYAQLI